MDVKDMDFNEYCGLNRPRFTLDPVADGSSYFGNTDVETELLGRIDNDMVVRGVPKCGVTGRYGGGKTHTLEHVRYILEVQRASRQVDCFMLRLEPYDERADGGGWPFIHGKALDAVGEVYLRATMRAYDRQVEDKTVELSEQLKGLFRFGDENLRSSMANVLSGYFVRETKSTAPAWQWLKGGKLDRGSVGELGVIKAVGNVDDMVCVLLNLGVLVRATTGRGMLLLIDEGQGLNGVEKKDKESHFGFRMLAEPSNQDVGFIIAYQGEGQGSVPKVLLEPDDIVSRLGVTQQNLSAVFIDLTRLISSESKVREFITGLGETVHDQQKAEVVIKEFELPDGVTWNSLPFSEDALDRLAEIIWGNEMWRNPRMMISEVARVAADSYNEAKQTGHYVVVDRPYVDLKMKDAA